MKNLSKTFGLILMIVMLMFGGVANAETIEDTLVYNVDTLVVGDTVIQYSDTNYVFIGIVETISCDSIKLEYHVHCDISPISFYFYDENDNPIYISYDEHITGDYGFYGEYIYRDNMFTIALNENKLVQIKLRASSTTDLYTDFYLDLTFNHSSGISDLETKKNEITLYPNPVVNSLNISGEFKTAIVFDISGKMLLTTDNPTIDMSEFKNGVYIINIDGVSHKIELER